MTRKKKCPHCNYEVEFRRGHSLKRHVKRKHPDHHQQFLIDYEKQYGIKKRVLHFNCKCCGKKQTSDYPKEFCDQSCAATYNNPIREIKNRKDKAKPKRIQKLKNELLKILKGNGRNYYRFDTLQKKVCLETYRGNRIRLESTFFGSEFLDSFKYERIFQKDYFEQKIDSITEELYNEIKSHSDKINKQRKANEKKAIAIIEKYQITEYPSFFFNHIYKDFGLEDMYWFSEYNRRYSSINKFYIKKQPNKLQDIYVSIIENIVAEREKQSRENYHSYNSSSPIQHERIARDKFDKVLFPLLKSKGYVIHEEFKVCSDSNHRIDYFITKGDFQLGIEYKSGKASWTSHHLEKQKNFYEENLKDKFPNVKVLIVSDTGKYGLSDEECLELF